MSRNRFWDIVNGDTRWTRAGLLAGQLLASFFPLSLNKLRNISRQVNFNHRK